MKKTEELQVIVRIVNKEVNTKDFPENTLSSYTVHAHGYFEQIKTEKIGELKAYKQALRKLNAIKKILHTAKVDTMSDIVAYKLKIKQLEDKGN